MPRKLRIGYPRAVRMSGAGASYDISGQAATVVRGYPMVAAQGSYATTGQATTLTPGGGSGGGLPTPATTGYVHTGVTLTAYAGNYIVSTPNTVIDSKLFTDTIEINAANVTIKRCKFLVATGSDWAPLIIRNTASNYLIEDVEIASPSDTNRFDRSIKIQNAPPGNNGGVIRRVYAHGGTRGLDFTGGSYITLEDCFLGYNYNPGTGERDHASCLRAAGGTHHVTFTNCVLGIGYNCFASGIAAFYPENGANHDIAFIGGLWKLGGNNDGGYGGAFGYTPPEQQNYNFTIQDLYISCFVDPATDADGHQIGGYAIGMPSGVGQQWNEMGGTAIWSNVRKYNPDNIGGLNNHNTAISP
jgi:hypothetical protein